MQAFRVSAEINFENLRHNLKIIRDLSQGAKIMAMVKGNAYGHGMVTVAKHLRDVDYFGVVGIEAAMALRHSGVIQPIVLSTGFQTLQELELMLEHHIDTVIFDMGQIFLIQKFLKNLQDKNKDKNQKIYLLKTWLKLDTGMHRLGFPAQDLKLVQEAFENLEKLKSDNLISEILFMTHFANADQEESLSVKNQLEKFLKITEIFSQSQLNTHQFLKSAANSGAVLNYPEACLDIVRPGLMLYGVSPSYQIYPKNKLNLNLKPLMTLKSKIISLHTLNIGERVGYGSSWKALRETKLAVISIGYGDGYPQHAKEGTPVLIHGQKAYLAGRVSMDSITVDITDIQNNCAIGDEVILWGENLPIEEVAYFMGVSVYALLTGVTSRVTMEMRELE